MEVPPDLEYVVDVEAYGHPLDFTKPEELTIVIINGYIYRIVKYYSTLYSIYNSEELWDLLREDFVDFTTPVFTKADQVTLRSLREYLVVHGVWVGKVTNTSPGVISLWKYISAQEFLV